MKIKANLPTSKERQSFSFPGMLMVSLPLFLGICLLGHIIYLIIAPTTKSDFGPDKTFVVDKESMPYRAFRPVTRTDFDPNKYFYYVQESDNSDADERRIIIRRKEDGIFFAAKLKDPNTSLQKGQKIKLMLIQCWRCPTALDEYLLAEP